MAWIRVLVVVAALLAVVPQQASAAPSPVSGVWTVPGNGQVTISWEPSAGSTSYRIYESTTAGALGVVVGTVAAPSTTYVRTGRTNGTRYFYTVRGYDGATESGDPVRAFTTAATLPNGRSIACVGVIDGNIYVMGGYNTGSMLTSIMSVDPILGTASTVAQVLPTTRGRCGTADANGKLYLMGGENAAGTAQSSILEFTPGSNAITKAAVLPGARANGAAVNQNGRIYLYGGDSGSSGSTAIYRYDPVADTAPVLDANLPSNLTALTASRVDGQGYVVGGEDFASQAPETDVTRHTTGTVTPRATMPSARSYSAAAAVNQVVYHFAGEDGVPTPVEKHDTAANTSSALAISVPDGVVGARAVSIRGFIYLLGGRSGAAFPTAVRRFDPGGQASATANASAASAPSALTVTPAAGQATISWTGGSNVHWYRVFRSTVAGERGSLIEEAAGVVNAPRTSIVDTGISYPGTSYYYTVTAVGYDDRETAATAQVGTTVARNATVAHWAGDGSFLDSSDTDNPLTNGASPDDATFTAGRFGDGFSFDSDTVSAPSNSAYDSASYTVETWLRATDPGGAALPQYPVVIERSASVANRQFRLGWDLACACPHAKAFEFSLSTTSGTTWLDTDGGPLLDGRWHHVAAVAFPSTSGGVSMRLYVDGVEQARQEVTGTLLMPAQPVVLGNNYVGDLDEVRIHDFALSAAAIRDSYERDAPMVSGTQMNVAGCATGQPQTVIGTVLAGAAFTTGTDCTIGFGSSDSTAALRMVQADGVGSAMWSLTNGAALDASFAGGTANLDVVAGAEPAVATAVDPARGRVYVAGGTGAAGLGNSYVAAFDLASGNEDTSFAGGSVNPSYVAADDEFKAMAIQPDGRIVVVGVADDKTLVARFNTDGSPDTTFSGDGVVIRQVGTMDDYLQSVTIQPDGRILVIGDTYRTSEQDMMVLRLNGDGSLDTSFSGDGMAFVDVSGNEYSVTGHLQPDGRIVLGGTMNNDAVAARLTANGTLDTSFSGDGMAQVNFNALTEFYSATALAADGGLLLAGFHDNGVVNGAAVAKLRPDGTRDTDFGTNGSIRIDRASKWGYADAIAVAPRGEILVTGQEEDGVHNLARLTTAGVLDTDFATDGIWTEAIGVGWGRSRSIALGVDGRVALAGNADIGGEPQAVVTMLDSSRISDYDVGTTDWDTAGTNAFGACVRTASTWVASSVYGLDGASNCAATDATPWHAVPATAAEGGQLARTTDAGVIGAEVDVRFGVRTTLADASGSYVAPVVFEVVAPELTPPTNVELPGIGGGTSVRAAVTATVGRWNGSAAIRYRYQWQRCNAAGTSCTDIPAATDASYVLTSADAGVRVRVRVTARNSEGSATADSAVSAPINPGTQPQLIFNTGYEHETLSTAGSSNRLFTGAGSNGMGAIALASNDIVHSGGAALKLTNPGGQEFYTQSSSFPGATRRLVVRSTFNVTRLPSSSELEIMQINGSATAQVEIGPDGRVRVQPGAGAPFTYADVSIEEGRWYTLDMLYITAGATHTLDWALDGRAQTQASWAAGSAASLSSMYLGSDGPGAGDASEVYHDDWAISATEADYPLSAGMTIGLSPDGRTAGTSGEGSFLNDGGGVLNGTTLGRVDDRPLSDGSQWVYQNTTGAASHLEWTFANPSPWPAADANGVRGTFAYNASASVNGNTRMVLQNGVTETPILTGNMASTAPNHYAGLNVPAPGSATWDALEVGGLKMRSGFATATQARWQGFMYEVDYPTTSQTSMELPVVSGAPHPGSTLTATAGEWSGAPTSAKYWWLRCDLVGEACSAIGSPSASNTYSPTVGDQGKTIRVMVIATFGSGSTAVQQTVRSAPTGAVASATPSPIYINGFESGNISTAGTGPYTGLWDGGVGMGHLTVDSRARRSGNYALKVERSGLAQTYLQYNVQAPTTSIVTRFAFRFDSRPTDEEVFVALPESSGGVLNFGWDDERERLWIDRGAGAAREHSLEVIELGRWYVIDIRATNVAANNWTGEWSIDGVAQPTSVYTGGAGTPNYTMLRMGGMNTLLGGRWHFDDLVISKTGADYPFGWGRVQGLRPNATGAHSGVGTWDRSQAAFGGPFAQLGTLPGADVGQTGATNTWNDINDPALFTSNDLLRHRVVAPAYAEYELEDVDTTQVANGVRMMGVHNEQNAIANNVQGLLALGGNPTPTLYTVDPPVTQSYYAGMSTTRPAGSGGGPWTGTDIDALRLRLSSTNVGTLDTNRPVTQAAAVDVDFQTDAAPTAIRGPSITTAAETPRVGVPLRVDRGEWTGAVSSWRYEWEACNSVGTCVAVGADQDTYTPLSFDRGEVIRVFVTAISRNGGSSRLTRSTTPIASARPTLDWITGFEHRGLTAGPSGLFSAITGAPTIDTAVGAPRHGSASGRFQAAGAAVAVSAAPSSLQSRGVMRVAVRLDALPAAATGIAQFTTTGGQTARITVDNVGRIRATLNGVSVPEGPLLTVGRWYVVDARLDAATTIWRLDWRVDGKPMETAVRSGMAADTVASMQFGVTQAATMQVHLDDIATSIDRFDYPIGDGKVIGFKVDGAGNHFDDASRFDHTGGGAIDATTPGRLDDMPMTSTADGVRQNLVGANSYLEFTLENPWTEDAGMRGVRAELAFRQTAAVAMPYTARASREGDADAVAPAWLNGVTSAATTSQQHLTGMVTAPTAGWTTHDLWELDLRLGYFASLPTTPIFDAVMVEAEFPTTPIGPTALERPVVSGSLAVGSVLSSTSGVWAAPQGSARTFEWLRCGPWGEDCVVIAGQTASTYTLTATDYGTTTRARVTSTGLAGTGSVMSEPTGVLRDVATAPVFVAKSNTTTAIAASVSIVRPAGTLQGHTMVASICLDSGAASTVSAPAGWWLLGRSDAGAPAAVSGISCSTYFKVAGSTANDNGPYVWGVAPNDRIVGAINSFSGTNTAAPINSFAMGSGAAVGTALVAPSLTTTVPNTLLMSGAGYNANVTFTAAGGMTERWDHNGGASTVASHSATEVIAAAGATGTRTVTASAVPGDAFVTMSVALAP